MSLKVGIGGTRSKDRQNVASAMVPITIYAMTLYDLLLQQIAEMQMAQKNPCALKIDHDSADALSRELGNGILITKGQRIAGLEIKITNEPAFEVVDADTLEREDVREILKTVQLQYPSLTLGELERIFHATYDREAMALKALTK